MFFFEKTEIGISKKFLFFLKSLKVAKLHYKATGKVRILKAFQKCGVFLKKMDGFFRKEISYFSKKMIKVVNLQLNATELVIFLNTFKNWDFENKMVIRRKTLRFSKTAKCRKFAVECNWISRFSLNVQKFRISVEKKNMGFSIKFLIFFKIAESSQIALQLIWNSKNSRNVEKIGVF